MVDRISVLADDILVNIISRLTLKESARTSALAYRWRNLWKSFSGCLDFIDPYITRHLAIMADPYYKCEDEDIIGPKRRNLVNSVDQILGSLQSRTVERLKICYPVSAVYDVDSWVQFAAEKKVHSLVLDFSESKRDGQKLHTFSPCLEASSTFSSLTSLQLTCVDIAGEFVEHLLSHCKLLEVLRLKGSDCLKTVRVSGPSLKLKYLELRDLPNLFNLEIDAANLLSLEFNVKWMNVNFKNVPLLAEMSVEGDYATFIVYNLLQPSSFLSQLRILKLDLSSVTVSEEILNSIPKFPNLKILELAVVKFGQDCYLSCVAFLKAAPLLHELTLKVFFSVEPCQYVQNLKDHPPLNLRTMSFMGFEGQTADTDFLKDLFENAVMLKKIAIDPCKPNLMGSPVAWFSRRTDVYKSARNCAIELAENFPHLEFSIAEVFSPLASSDN